MRRAGDGCLAKGIVFIATRDLEDGTELTWVPRGCSAGARPTTPDHTTTTTTNNNNNNNNNNNPRQRSPVHGSKQFRIRAKKS